MKKLIQKLIRVIPLIAMILFVLPLTGKAEEEKMVAIQAKVPSDWAEPSIWAWDADGNNAFAAWPGETMDKLPETDGWYYVWIPEWADHVIISGANATVQTDELVLEKKNSWIEISDAKTVSVSTDDKTRVEVPAFVKKFSVHVKTDASWEKPHLWAWSAPDGKNVYEKWPGKEMRLADTGWYEARVPEWVNSLIVNANEGNVKTEDLAVDPAEIWITVDKDGKTEMSYKDPDKASVPNITVYVKAPEDWATPNLWAWSAPDGTNVFAAWPGEPLESGEDGWLKKEVPGWVNSLIVNGNEGKVQTSDITVEVGKDVWLTVTDKDTVDVAYEKPADTEKNVDKTDNQSTSEKTGANENGRYGVLVGVIVAILIVLCAVVFIYMRKNRRK